MIEQHHLLNSVADLIDSKKIKTTLTNLFTPISTENLRKAHKKLESGNAIGKIVLSGF
jgi:NADPH:quinone reductase-like Zn-dependent oxidoreductase